MKNEFQYIDTTIRGYNGVSLTETETKALLSKEVKNVLIDKPQKEELLNVLETLKQDTGFENLNTIARYTIIKR